MYYQDSLKKVSDHAIRLYLDYPDDRAYFHNLTHTARVVDAINKINSQSPLDDRSYFIVCSAAWPHDLEIITSDSTYRQTGAVKASEEILPSLGISSEDTEEIKKCILATKIPQEPSSWLEKIVCDAQTFYFGSPSYWEYNRLLRKEIEAFAKKKFKGRAWRAWTISVLENHRYHTPYCQSLLNEGKEHNLRALIRKQVEPQWQSHLATAKHSHSKSPHDHRSHLHIVDEEELSLPSELHGSSTLGVAQQNQFEPTPKKSKHHLRGVETMFRNSSSNHQRLSVMADNKAFIMISVNSILISVAIGLIIGKFVLIPKLFLPTVLLLTVNVVTIIYSVLATRPGVMRGTFTRKDVEEKTVDLLFFGNFYKMPLEDFEYGMREMMDDSEFLYGTLIKDIYSQGKILGRKFRLLRISYNIFMYGTAATVVAFIISFLF
jgi:hypothetical protein